MKEPIHTIWAYFDEPLTGLADFEGRPHHYEREFDEAADAYSDVFRLTPISEPIFKLAIEQSQIFDRWREVYQTGATSIDTHPALPADRLRYEELQRVVGEHLANARKNVFRAKGQFNLVRSDQRGSRQKFEVTWFPLNR